MPNCELSSVHTDKIQKYLLSDTHKDGKSKAVFFKMFGFEQATPDTFRDSLLDHANNREVTKMEENGQGIKYVLECEMETPDERNPCIRTIWIIKSSEKAPKLVTAYPA